MDDERSRRYSPEIEPDEHERKTNGPFLDSGNIYSPRHLVIHFAKTACIAHPSTASPQFPLLLLDAYPLPLLGSPRTSFRFLGASDSGWLLKGLRPVNRCCEDERSSNWCPRGPADLLYAGLSFKHRSGESNDSMLADISMRVRSGSCQSRCSVHAIHGSRAKHRPKDPKMKVRHTGPRLSTTSLLSHSSCSYVGNLCPYSVTSPFPPMRLRSGATAGVGEMLPCCDAGTPTDNNSATSVDDGRKRKPKAAALAEEMNGAH